jgi:hypothetical protein
MCVDLKNFSRFNRAEAASAQTRLMEVLRRTRRHAGIRGRDTVLQPLGDGEFAILPLGLNGAVAIPKLVEGMRLALRDINRDLSDHARLRLRFSLYQGQVSRGPDGWGGHATIAVHRFLDAPVTRSSLDQNAGADFVLIVGADVYRDHISDERGLLSKDGFSNVVVDVPSKNFNETAWIYVPPVLI